jgi:hypothetical protein
VTRGDWETATGGDWETVTKGGGCGGVREPVAHWLSLVHYISSHNVKNTVRMCAPNTNELGDARST